MTSGSKRNPAGPVDSLRPLTSAQRERVDLARRKHLVLPSRAFPRAEGQGVVATFVGEEPSGWLVTTGAIGHRLALLETYEGATLRTLAMTGDEAWSFAPYTYGSAPGLAAHDAEGELVAASRELLFGDVEIALLDRTLRIRGRLRRLRMHWDLQDERGKLGEVWRTVARRSVLDTVNFEWSRDGAWSPLLPLFVTYCLVTRASRVDLSFTTAGSGA